MNDLSCFKIVILFLFILVSCQEKETSCIDCIEKKDELIMYEPSELASLNSSPFNGKGITCWRFFVY